MHVWTLVCVCKSLGLRELKRDMELVLESVAVGRVMSLHVWMSVSVLFKASLSSLQNWVRGPVHYGCVMCHASMENRRKVPHCGAPLFSSPTSTTPPPFSRSFCTPISLPLSPPLLLLSSLTFFPILSLLYFRLSSNLHKQRLLSLTFSFSPRHFNPYPTGHPLPPTNSSPPPSLFHPPSFH